MNLSKLSRRPRTLWALLLLASLAALTAVSVACGPARSSSDDEPCTSDDDCREGKLCRFKEADDAEGECRSSNIGNPDSSTNNSTDNTSIVRYCADLSTKYLECEFLTSADLESFTRACQSTGTVDTEFLSCTLDVPCRALPESCEEDDVGFNNGFNNPTPSPPSGGPYRFVMVEDASSHDPTGPAPGADIDAIGLDVDGDQVIDHWASTVEDFNLGGDNNEHLDAAELLGEPDSDCEAQSFLSLGGTSGDNFVIVGFGGGFDVTFGSGAIVQVWELGPTNCPNQTEWTDDETTIAISLSNDRFSFEQIGTVGVGTNAIFIP